MKMGQSAMNQMPPGGFQMPQGGFQMPQGGFQMPQGGFQMPQGGMQNMPGGFPNMPGGFPNMPGGMPNMSGLGQGGFDPSNMLNSVTSAIKGKMAEGATPCDKPPTPPPAPTPDPTPLQKNEKEKIEQNMVEWLKKSINSEGGSNPIVSGLATLLENNIALIDRIADKTLAKIKEKEAEAATAPPPSYAEATRGNNHPPISGAGVVKKRTKRSKRNKRKKRTKRRM